VKRDIDLSNGSVFDIEINSSCETYSFNNKRLSRFDCAVTEYDPTIKAAQRYRRLLALLDDVIRRG
jgi:hypothetical protein